MSENDVRYANQVLENLETNVRAVRFDNALGILPDLDWKRLTHAPPLVLLRIKCFVADALDYAGHYSEAVATIAEDGRDCERALNALVDGQQAEMLKTDLQRILWKQQVWVLIHWAYTFYRAHDYIRAHSLLRLCRIVLDDLVSTDQHPSYSIKARVAYTVGLIHRQRHEYGKAKFEFREAMNCALRSLERKPNDGRDTSADFLVAKSLSLGLGWIYYTEGQLDIAEPLLIAARTFLSRTQDRLIRAYVDVVHACIQRSAHSSNLRILEDAIKLLKRSRRTFVKERHELYNAIAANELALAYLHRALSIPEESGGRTRERALRASENYTLRVEQFAIQDHDPRGHCYALISKSRISRIRGRNEASDKYALEALEIAKDDPFSRIDALITCGEAQRELKAYDTAAASFKAALSIGADNPKVHAVCNLHLTSTYLRAGEVKLANEHFKKWQMVKPLVENAFVKTFGDKVEQEMNNSTRDFFVSFLQSDLDADQLETTLHGFLARWAKYHSKSDEEAAERLKRSKATLYNWIAAERKIEKPRKKV